MGFVLVIPQTKYKCKAKSTISEAKALKYRKKPSDLLGLFEYLNDQITLIFVAPKS